MDKNAVGNDSSIVTLIARPPERDGSRSSVYMKTKAMS